MRVLSLCLMMVVIWSADRMKIAYEFGYLDDGAVTAFFDAVTKFIEYWFIKL